MKASSLIIIQPLLASYRKDFFNDMTYTFKEVTIFSDLKPGEGFQANVKGLFKTLHAQTLGRRSRIYYQKGIISSILKNRPTAIFITADFRALHFWLILIISKVLNIPTFSHGQGLYNKPNPSLIQKLMFKIATSLSSQYICYTEFSKQTLLNIGINKNKLFVMDNTIVNKTPVTPVKKTQKTQRLFYLGRLREGCNLELLFSALSKLNQDGYALGVDILGDGTQRTELEKTAKSLNLDIKFYGAVYDEQTIADLSMNSTIGIYPGDAGLSMLFFFSILYLLENSDNKTQSVLDYANATLYIGLIAAIYAVVQGNSSSQYVIRLRIGDFASPIPLAILLGQAFLISLYKLLHSKKQLEKLILLSIIPFIFYALLLTNTRSVIIGLIISVSLFLILSRSSFTMKMKLGFITFLVIGIPLALTLLANSEEIYERSYSGFIRLLSGDFGKSESDRLDAWLYGFEAFSQNVLMGIGTGHFGQNYIAYPHNIFIEIMTENGLIGLVLITTIIAIGLYSALKAKSNEAKLISALFIFMLFISQVSLTLWMHKALFIWLAFISFYSTYNSKVNN